MLALRFIVVLKYFCLEKTTLAVKENRNISVTPEMRQAASGLIEPYLEDSKNLQIM